MNYEQKQNVCNLYKNVPKIGMGTGNTISNPGIESRIREARIPGLAPLLFLMCSKSVVRAEEPGRPAPKNVHEEIK
jgi:hypothetical protein